MVANIDLKLLEDFVRVSTKDFSSPVPSPSKVFIFTRPSNFHYSLTPHIVPYPLFNESLPCGTENSWLAVNVNVVINIGTTSLSTSTPPSTFTPSSTSKNQAVTENKHKIHRTKRFRNEINKVIRKVYQRKLHWIKYFTLLSSYHFALKRIICKIISKVISYQV